MSVLNKLICVSYSVFCFYNLSENDLYTIYFIRVILFLIITCNSYMYTRQCNIIISRDWSLYKLFCEGNILSVDRRPITSPFIHWRIFILSAFFIISISSTRTVKRWAMRDKPTETNVENAYLCGYWNYWFESIQRYKDFPIVYIYNYCITLAWFPKCIHIQLLYNTCMMNSLPVSSALGWLLAPGCGQIFEAVDTHG